MAPTEAPATYMLPPKNLVHPKILWLPLWLQLKRQ